MKKYRIVFALVLVFAMALSGTYAFADGPSASNEGSYTIVSPRASEHLRVDTTTDFWRNAPREGITNERICYLSPGDTLNYISFYTDPTGVNWWYAKIINCAAATYLNGAYGYVRASAVTVVVG